MMMEQYDGQIPCITKDGKKLVVELLLNEVTDHTGEKLFIVVLHDITSESYASKSPA